MNLDIDQIRPALPEEWDAIWRDCSYATYFHSREWAEIWSHRRQGKLRPNPLSVVFTDGKKALLPLSCKISGGSVWSFVSSPDGEYGGWIAVDPIGRKHAILMKEYLTKELGPRLYWYVNPYDSLVAASEVDAKKVDETYVINLERGFKAVYSNWSSACRNSERKARRCGVLVKCAEAEEEWCEYYQVYEDCLRRWGDRALSRYDWALFEDMLNRRSDHLRLWLALVNNHVIAGVLVCYARKHVSAWHSAALERYFALRPLNRLFYEIIWDACEGEYRWFDFGPSAGLEGVRRFKKTFGATPLDFSVVYVEPANG